MSGKTRFVGNVFARFDVRVIVGIFLLIYCLYSWNEHQQLVRRLRHVKNAITIFHQMNNYAREVCDKKTRKPTVDIEEDMKQVMLTKVKHGVTSDTVDDELTFILLGPTLRCISNQVSWIRKLYKKVKIIVVIDTVYTIQNQEGVPQESAQTSYLLGGFNNKPEALNRAIKIVTTKYFIILDHSVDLVRMKTDFVQVLMLNMPGFHVLSGSEINMNNEFVVPCQRLRLRNWSLLETYEYTIHGNILHCDSTSLFFIGRTDAFKHPTYKDLFDVRLPQKWLQDFFIRFKDILQVGVLPEVIIRRRIPPSNCFHVPPPTMSPLQKVDALLPFANKYQIFYFDNENGREGVCRNSGSVQCSEQNICRKWSIGKSSTTGLTTYPFIIESLKNALHFGGNCLKEAHITYVLEGGTSLGLIKIRDILPWDHGDVDTFVYSTRRRVINMVMKTYREYGYPYLLRHTGFHTYVSEDSGTENGCIVYVTRRVRPKAIVYLRHNGKLFPVKREIFKFLRNFYGPLYFESHLKYTDKRSYCTVPGHHACMPDCRWHGCGGGHGAFPGIM